MGNYGENEKIEKWTRKELIENHGCDKDENFKTMNSQ